MKTEQLKAIINKSAYNLVALGEECENDIIKSIHQAAEEAQMHDKEKVRVKLSYSIVIDIGSNKLSNSLSFSTKQQRSVDVEIPNPNQPELFTANQQDND